MNRQLLYGIPEPDHLVHHWPADNQECYYCPSTDSHYRIDMNTTLADSRDGSYSCVGCGHPVKRAV